MAERLSDKHIDQEIGYLKEYTSKHPDEPTSTYIREQLSLFEEDKSKIGLIHETYRNVRIGEKKVPSLIFPEDSKRIPNITIPGPLEREVTVKQHGDLTTVYLNGMGIVSYSSSTDDFIGKRVGIDEKGIKGYLFFNSDFFSNFDPQKRIQSESEMRNIAKTFFRLNGKNHVALVQYMCPRGTSKEHFHTLPELVVQLAGGSHWELRNANNDSLIEERGLEPGEILFLPPRTIHRVTGYEDGSITVPIKQTLGDKSDHNLQPKSKERMMMEIREIVKGDNLSGNEILSKLKRYQTNLSANEKETYEEAVDALNETSD